MINLNRYIKDPQLLKIADNITAGTRISQEEGLILYQKAGLPLLGILAGMVRRRKNGNYAFFIRNFHIEPTNKCIYNCRFCSYHKPSNDPESWEFSQDEILQIIKRNYWFSNKPVIFSSWKIIESFLIPYEI